MVDILIATGSKFLSTPSARRATAANIEDAKYYIISIHALREEGDPFLCQSSFSVKQFLSTPSARRATTGKKKPLRP